MVTTTITRPGYVGELLVDEVDSNLLLFTWSLAGGKKRADSGKLVGLYASRSVGGTTEYLHRVIAQRMGLIHRAMGTEGGCWKLSVDHINGNKLDNRRSNLRVLNRKQQMSNTNDPLRSNNSSGYRGVSFIKKSEPSGKPWMAYVQIDYKSKSLGLYATAEEAAAARARWDAKHRVAA